MLYVNNSLAVINDALEGHTLPLSVADNSRNIGERGDLGRHHILRLHITFLYIFCLKFHANLLTL